MVYLVCGPGRLSQVAAPPCISMVIGCSPLCRIHYHVTYLHYSRNQHNQPVYESKEDVSGGPRHVPTTRLLRHESVGYTSDQSSYELANVQVTAPTPQKKKIKY